MNKKDKAIVRSTSHKSCKDTKTPNVKADTVKMNMIGNKRSTAIEEFNILRGQLRYIEDNNITDIPSKINEKIV